MLEGDLKKLEHSCVKATRMSQEARTKVHASDHTQLCRLLVFPCMTAAWQCTGLFDSPNFDWNGLFGKRGNLMSDVLHYGYEQMHAKMRLGVGFDCILAYPGWAMATLAHWGDLLAANKAFDHMMPSAMRCMEEWVPVDVHVIVYTKTIWPFWLYVMGRKEDARAMLYAGPFDELQPQFEWIGEVSNNPIDFHSIQSSERNRS